MSDESRLSRNRERRRARDVPDEAHVRDLMWSMGQVLYDLLIWMRDAASSPEAASPWHAEADEVAGHMERAAVADRDTQWHAYETYARRHTEVARLVDEADDV